MSDVVILAEGLSKRYRIGAAQEPYGSLRESLMRTLRSPLGRRGSKEDTIWAVKDVSFEIGRGEVVGIIGRNGAGKSTLLKILSRITKPTEGQAVIRGRVGSLLEVGTGFHPELTGRENIYLNGAILGMQRREIERRFDEIVDFSEIEKFLETPVKRYSSGMYVRLAFAVAAHMEPEILLVDEVLAVGDAAFQKKCLGKMGEVAEGGRTVLFVSHNMSAVISLCNRCLLIESSRIAIEGNPKKVIDRYIQGKASIFLGSNPGEYSLEKRSNRYASGEILAQSITLHGSDQVPRDTFLMGESLYIRLKISGLNRFQEAWIGLIFRSSFGQILASTSTAMVGLEINKAATGWINATFSLSKIPFTPGKYSISISITKSIYGRIDYVEDAAFLTLESNDVYGTGYEVGPDYGIVYLDGNWQVN